MPVRVSASTAHVLAAVLLVLAVAGCASTGAAVGVSIPVGPGSAVGVSVGTDGRIRGGIGVFHGGVGISVGGSTSLPAPAPEEKRQEGEPSNR